MSCETVHVARNRCRGDQTVRLILNQWDGHCQPHPVTALTLLRRIVTRAVAAQRRQCGSLASIPNQDAVVGRDFHAVLVDAAEDVALVWFPLPAYLFLKPAN